MKVERIESGIPGFDGVIGGGFVKGSVNLIAGSTGTCKTIFCTQFIWHGLQKGERGLYMSLEESAEDIRAEALEFGMDFSKYEKEKKCAIEYVYPKSFSDLVSEVLGKIKEVKASRFVLDAVTLLGFYMEGTEKLRDKVFTLFQKLKALGVTALVVSEIPEGSNVLSRFGFEEFVADSVITLHYLEHSAGGTLRSVIVRKMRRTAHGSDIYPFEIAKNGIVVRKS